MRALAPLCFGLLLLGCASAKGTLPSTLGERASGFGYIPLDGLAISTEPDQKSCFFKDANSKVMIRDARPLLEDLPDLSVRFAVASFDGNGALTFGPAKTTISDGRYHAVLDYVNVDAIPVDFLLSKLVKPKGATEPKPRPMFDAVSDDEEVTGYVVHLVKPNDTAGRARVAATNVVDPVTIPVYVGIGMRLTADLRALKSGITLSSLGSIAADAQASSLSGTLTVQTLGVNGKSVATSLPLPSKLDQTTVENGILALGSARAFIYGGTSTASDVRLTPRIVGLYSPVGSDPRLINEIYSELSRTPPLWIRSCDPTASGLPYDVPPI